MYKCSSCSYTNKNAGTLSHHKKTHNPDQIPCEVCSKVFISRTYMQMHKRYKHDAAKVACHICSRRVKEFNLKLHEMRHTGYRHKCTLCSKSYMDQGSLFKHKKIHYPDQAKCNGCSQVFNSKQGMASHWERVHAKTRNFPCNQCDKIYKPGKGLNDHMVRIHSTQLNFQCKYCNKMFKVDRVMKKHMKDIHEQVFLPEPCKHATLNLLGSNVKCALKCSNPQAWLVMQSLMS